VIGYGAICKVDGIVRVKADGLRVEVDCGPKLFILEKVVGLSLQFFSLFGVLGRGRW